MTDADRIANLEREIAALKSPPDPSAAQAAADAYRSEMHALRERRANHIPQWMLRDVVGGVTTADAQDLVHHGVVQSPSQAGTSGQVTKVSTSPGLPGTGWREAAAIGPPPGIRYVDAICEAQSERERAEKIVEEAKIRAALKR
jgi:hypothetical protein